MAGHSGGRELVSVAAFGAAVALVVYLVFRPPADVARFLAAHGALGVAATVVTAAVAAYSCRRVVQALLRLCGFR